MRTAVTLLALFWLSLLVACGSSSPAPAATPTPAPSKAFANAQFLVDTLWLAQHLEDDGLRIVDMRAQSRYGEGHIPGAVNLTVAGISDPDNPVPVELVSLERMQDILGSLGIEPNDRVIIYDDGNMMAAARLFWALDYYGHPSFSVLDGGYARWLAESRTVSKAAPQVTATLYTAGQAQPEKLATKTWVLDSLSMSGALLLDVRSEGEFTGQIASAARGGHISGAVNVDWGKALTGGDTPVLRPAGELAAMYEAAGVTPDREVATYCQTGQRAAHSYFVLRLLGYSRVRLYDGSWAEWGNDASLPVEK